MTYKELKMIVHTLTNKELEDIADLWRPSSIISDDNISVDTKKTKICEDELNRRKTKRYVDETLPTNISISKRLRMLHT